MLMYVQQHRGPKPQDLHLTYQSPLRKTRARQTVILRRQPRPLTPVPRKVQPHSHLHPVRHFRRLGPRLYQRPDHTRPTAQGPITLTIMPQHQHLNLFRSTFAYGSTTSRPTRTTSERTTVTYQRCLPKNRRGQIPRQNPRPPTPLGTPVYDMLLTLITTTEIYACVIGRERSPADKGY